MAGVPVFPGGTSVSHLRVYDWPAADAPGGSGSPHLHTTSTEAYVVLSGRGRVETLGPQGFASHDLTPGRIVWFAPGVVHRAVNDGGLEVLVVMSNAGLPEAGDAVLTFPPEILASPEEYRRAVTLPQPAPVVPGDGPSVETPGAGSRAAGGDAAGARSDGTLDARADRLDPPDGMAEDEAVAAAALARRDLALIGYEALREAVEAGGPAALEPFYEEASRLVAPRAEGWRDLWTTTVARATSDTGRALALLAGLAAGPGPDGGAGPEDGVDQAGGLGPELPATPVGHLMEGAVTAVDARPGPRRYGMCGRLRVWATR